MATQQELMGILERAAYRAEDTADAEREVLVSEGERDVTLSDGTVTPNLNKRIKLLGSQVTSVVGKKGDITISDISEKLELGSASKYDAADLPISAAQKALNDKNITIVESIADLNAIKDPKDGQVVFVRSYHAGLSKGGANYKYTVSSKKWSLVGVENITTPEVFGAKGGKNNDQKAFTDLSDKLIYALDKEYTVPVWRTSATRVIGNNTVVNVDSVNGDTTVCLQIKPNSHYSDIDFINNPSKAKSWSYSAIGNGSVLTNVGFYNFDDNVTPKNSWGIYLENRENITLNSPRFGGNGVSDIAILDNVKNITINNARNTVSGGVHLDIEPNVAGNINNINIVGGNYSAINVLENDYLNRGIKGLNITGATIELLELRGGQTIIKGGEVSRIKGNWANFPDYAGYQSEYFCQLQVDNFNLSKNLINDPYLVDISLTDSDSFWSIYAPANLSMSRVTDDQGVYLSINNNQMYINQILNSRNFISIDDASKPICVVMSYSTKNKAETMFEPVLVYFYNKDDVLIGNGSSIKGGRVPNSTNSEWATELSIFDVPKDAVKLKVAIRSNKTASTLNVRKFGIHQLSKCSGVGNFNRTIDEYSNVVSNLTYKRDVLPTNLDYFFDGLNIEVGNSLYKYVKKEGVASLVKLY